MTTTTIERRSPVIAPSGHPTVRPPAAAHLSDEDVARLGAELDAIRDEVIASRGASDAAYIRRMIRLQRTLEIGGRAALVVASFPPAWVAGTAMLSIANKDKAAASSQRNGRWRSMLMVNFLAGSMTGAF